MENTIFFGNGINRLDPANISWDELLREIKGINDFQNGDLPNTMIYERIILDRPLTSIDVLSEEYSIKVKISELMKITNTNEYYKDLYNLNAQNFITTNYDYAFVHSILEIPEVNTPLHEYSSEDIYSLRRLKRISNLRESKKHFWQIHGEIRKPATIMLGLDHYCGEIGKIDLYTKGGYRYKDKVDVTEVSIIDKLINQTFTDSSWIELFFTSAIHILGFSLDYSEIDLWWIINKRARMKKGEYGHLINNEIIYYCDNTISEYQKGVLESMDIKVVITKLIDSDKKYFVYYDDVIKKIKSSIG